MSLNDGWRHALVGLGLASAACAGREAAAPGSAGIVVAEAPPPSGYAKLQALQVVSGRGCGVMGQAGSSEEAETKLRNRALQLGATYVQITRIEKPPLNHQCPALIGERAGFGVGIG